ncbi:hypothetical protein GIB67_041971 [Kingdonia uniflora]|uniref:Uncharacterized protein n=1 Tax=Kingdonia uniflora TaxID=39325 RepID=A0A7J7P0E8_9MAGN|nr:hypothetical protein GIB67_041971 [Kingdonia uniflora]
MLKLASAREIRLYETRLARNRLEYINAGLYVFATILVLGGFVAQFSEYSAKSGLVVLVITLGLIIFVNLHDLFAHLGGIDYRLSLMGFDTQLALVEFAVPVVYTLGPVLMFLAILFFFIQVCVFVLFFRIWIEMQAEQGRSHVRLGKNALNMLIVGPVLYERADRCAVVVDYISVLLNLLLLQLLCPTLSISKSTVTELPEFPGSLPFELETGYVGVGKGENVQLFYYFVKSDNNPKDDPIILWLTGGHVCSALIGFFNEIGPLQFVVSKYDGSLPKLTSNPYSWTKVCAYFVLT